MNSLAHIYFLGLIQGGGGGGAFKGGLMLPPQRNGLG